jgi:hypothetical protein
LRIDQLLQRDSKNGPGNTEEIGVAQALLPVPRGYGLGQNEEIG